MIFGFYWSGGVNPSMTPLLTLWENEGELSRWSWKEKNKHIFMDVNIKCLKKDKKGKDKFFSAQSL